MAWAIRCVPCPATSLLGQEKPQRGNHEAQTSDERSKVGLETATTTADGRDVFPRSPEDWQDWVSAGRTRNHVLGDPILDWLHLYGHQHRLLRDDELPGYDPRCDFTQFIFRQGSAFEAAVVAHLRGLTPVVSVADGPEDIRSLQKARETFARMQEGAPVIHQGVLFDAETRTYGAPDLLVRADELLRLFPGLFGDEEARIVAPDLPQSWHYRVVDIKFTTLHLTSGGQLANSGSSPAYRAQLFNYNRALGRLQGFRPPCSYLLGRSWEQTVAGISTRGAGCMERLAPIPQDYTFRNGPSLAQLVDEATDWVRRARREGGSWQLFPRPTVPELWPDMGNQEDGPWHRAKQGLAEQLGELTSLWQVGVEKRRKAHQAGIYDWRQPECVPQAIGVTGPVYQPTLHAVLDVNRSSEGPPVRPARVQTERDNWWPVPALEFYVDFETVTDVGDDFSRIPLRGGQAMIFMIGCGHVEGGQWRFRSFTASSLTEPAEAESIDAWLQHMAEVKARLDPHGPPPRLMHWSHAESSSFENAYNSAANRHPQKTWPSFNWFDLLTQVVRAEPVVIKGTLNFGLKQVARAFHAHGLSQTNWEEGPIDGLGAMAGAWWCAEQAAQAECPLADIPLMQEIARYNEVDCRVMMEILQYLRANR